ncbi:dTDP-4-amino-4,6-dideoxygalactose transaminase [Flavobacterium croceum DSM 17960]|uniref:dTDP-4-amino-4,6-dideoxygalactose transaminase n=1 Tax=Flavobacterium croceum DSM 17960 TaxID=1121886 RepID=A0A2S4N9H3_9FLAO|nr:DegT/DnrJ/EryC1/StrS family aminotransferase [Flavobacterium croceum]POS02349.1 dTDP-4-amino-4,6-dideoxygalactose transaminase [Flavobacterium croceum DSM 17960]
MTKNKIWLSSPHIGEDELKYVHEAFYTNWVAPLGPNVTGFEEDLENFLQNNKHVAALSSGTAALHLALINLGVGYGDEVICQSFTFAASANPIVYLGATPIFVDSEYTTWNICPKALEEAIQDRITQGKKPKAVIAVHLYGMPFMVDEILQLCNSYQIPLIEDSAEALGSTYKNKPCGTFGHSAVLSFNGNKIITTSGGGALVTSSVEEKNKTVFLATQARDNAPHYQHSSIGYNYRLSNICAGIGRGQMKVLHDRVDKRRAMNQFYSQIFKNSSIKVFTEPSSIYYSNHWLTAILTDSFETRENIRLELEKENIESRPLWKPLHLQPVFAHAPYYGQNVSEDIFNRGLCLPSGSNLTEEEKQKIKSILIPFVSK